MDRETESFSLLELNFAAAVTWVLNKPQWWTQWSDPVVRASWVSEIQTQFLSTTFDQCLLWTRKSIPTLANLATMANELYSIEKEAQVSQ